MGQHDRHISRLNNAGLSRVNRGNHPHLVAQHNLGASGCRLVGRLWNCSGAVQFDWELELLGRESVLAFSVCRLCAHGRWDPRSRRDLGRGSAPPALGCTCGHLARRCDLRLVREPPDEVGTSPAFMRLCWTSRRTPAFYAVSRLRGGRDGREARPEPSLCALTCWTRRSGWGIDHGASTDLPRTSAIRSDAFDRASRCMRIVLRDLVGADCVEESGALLRIEFPGHPSVFYH